MAKDKMPSLENAQDVDLGPLTGHVGFLLRQAQKAVFRSFIERFRDLDIKPHQYGMMTVIERNPGIKPSQIGEALDIQRANVGPALRVLEARVFIQRRKDRRDRRAYGVELTEDGRAILKIMRKVHAEHERDIRQALDKAGVPVLLEQLQSIVDRLDERGPAGPDQKKT